jgi:multicomponent Na+:H+ antiporter subunit D
VIAALLLLVANAVAKGSLYVATGALERSFDARTVAGLAGRGRDAPLTALAVAVAVASLVGLPPSLGFAGKWFLVTAAVDAGAWVVAAVVLVSTLFTLVYAGRVVERLYLGTRDDGAREDTTAAARDEPGTGTGPAAVTDGGRPTTGATGLAGRAATVALTAALATVLLGLASSGLADWVAPVVEGWL